MTNQTPTPSGGPVDGIRTAIASNDLHTIWVRGQDLAADIIGKRTFGEVVFLLVAGRMPNANELTMVDAILVSLMEHGLTPSAMIARVTYSIEPESFQGAVAAGLLGVGGVVLGSMQECGQILERIAIEEDAGNSPEEVIQGIVREYRDTGRRLPGLGHAIHTEGDPRTPRLFELAEECGFAGRHVDAIVALARAASGKKTLPVNVTGAVAAILLEMGIPWRLHRGFAIISRSAGLVGHIGEEAEHPITPAIRLMLRRDEGSPQ
jgi:citrate synthase